MVDKDSWRIDFANKHVSDNSQSNIKSCQQIATMITADKAEQLT